MCACVCVRAGNLVSGWPLISRPETKADNFSMVVMVVKTADSWSSIHPDSSREYEILTEDFEAAIVISEPGKAIGIPLGCVKWWPWLNQMGGNIRWIAGYLRLKCWSHGSSMAISSKLLVVDDEWWCLLCLLFNSSRLMFDDPWP